MVQGQAHEHHLKTADTRAEMQEQIGSHMYAPQQVQASPYTIYIYFLVCGFQVRCSGFIMLCLKKGRLLTNSNITWY